jgi:phage shock protein C
MALYFPQGKGRAILFLFSDQTGGGSESMEPKRLYRSRSNSMIAGVCGGLAEYIGMDPTVVRLLYVLISIFSAAFPGIIVYIIAMIIVPLED